MISLRRDLGRRRILLKIVGAEIRDIIAVQPADHPRRVGVRHYLVSRVYSRVEFVRVGIEKFLVENGSLRPIAVKSKERYVEIDPVASARGQGDKAFDIHAVFKGLVEILFVFVGQSNRNGHFKRTAGIDRNGVAVSRAVPGNGGDFTIGAVQKIAFLCHRRFAVRGISGADAFGEHKGVNIVCKRSLADIIDRKGHFVHARLIFIVLELEFGFIHYPIALEGGQIRRRGSRFGKVGKTRTLLSYRVGQADLVIGDIRRGHHDLIDERRYVLRVACVRGDVLLDVLTDQGGYARLVGRGHGRTRKLFVALSGHSRQNVSAVRGDFGLYFQVGGRTPGREIGHERTRHLIAADLDFARTAFCEQLAVVLRNRAHGGGSRPDRHGDFARNVVVNDDARSARVARRLRFILERRRAALYEGDLSPYVEAVVIDCAAEAGDSHVFERFFVFVFREYVVDEIFGFGSLVVGLLEVHDLALVREIRGLYAADGRNGKRRVIGGRRADRTRIGIGGKAEVAVLFRTERSVVIVGGRGDQADPRLLDIVVDLIFFPLVNLAGKAAGGTEGHIDDIDAERDAILQRGKNPGGLCAFVRIGEHLHDRELRVGRNARDRIVLPRDNARDVRAVRAVDGKNVGVLIRIIVRIGNLLAYVNVLAGKPRGKRRRSGRPHLFRNVPFGAVAERESEILVGRGKIIYAERRMRIIETRIEHGDYHAVALIFGIGAVENTRGIHVDVVFDDFGRRRLVFLADDQRRLRTEQLLQLVEIVGLDRDFKAA